MAFPKKYTRKIVVDDKAYLWHLNHNAIDTDVLNHITIQQADDRGADPLYLDPHPWSFQIRPKTIERAIRWALKNGWRPER